MSKGKNTKPFQHFFSKRENIFLIFIGLIPIFSPSLFEKLFNEYINKPIFENIESNILVDIIVIILTMIIVRIYDYKFGKRYFLSTFSSKIIFILTFWYLIYRFQGGWHYLSFSFYPSFFYSDILLIIPFSHLFILSQKLYKKKQKADISTNGFLIDEPTKEDSLGRESYAKAIAIKIKKSYPIKYAMAIGITGKWGSGKTTFMGLIEKALNQEEKPIIINFKPRKNHDSNNIIIDFFDELEETLGVYNENLSFNIHQYLKQLTTVDDNIYFKTIDFLNTIIFGKKSTQNMFDEINEAIEQIDRQVIIFIDDIDRLDSKEVIEVIKLIRFSANFNNVVFVVAYDKGYVINAINEFNTYEKEWFLEKIFQVEFPLPTFENNRLKSELEKKLISNFPEYKYQFQNYFTDESNYLIVDKCILTMRDLVRFSNAFCLDFDSVKDEVLVKDFINISLLKLKYSAVYEILFIEQKELFTGMAQTILDEKFTPSEPQYFISLNNTKMRQYLLKNKESLNLSRNKIDDIIEIIRIIFSQPTKKGTVLTVSQPERYNSDNILSIRKPSNFGIYFSIRLLEGNLSEIDFRNARKSSYENCLVKLNEWLELKLEDELLDKIEAITLFDDKNDFEQIIKILFHLGSIKEDLQSRSIEITKRNLMISEYRTDTNEKRYYDNNTENYRHFLNTILIDKLQDYLIDFKAKLIQSINELESSINNSNHLKFSIQKEERMSFMSEYIKIYFRESRGMKDLITLYDMCIIRTQNVPYINSVTKEINESMLTSTLKTNRVLELFEHIMPANEGPYYIATPYSATAYFKYLFPTKNNFDEFVKQIDKSVENKSINRYIEFVEKYFDKIVKTT